MRFVARSPSLQAAFPSVVSSDARGFFGRSHLHVLLFLILKITMDLQEVDKAVQSGPERLAPISFTASVPVVTAQR